MDTPTPRETDRRAPLPILLAEAFARLLWWVLQWLILLLLLRCT